MTTVFLLILAFVTPNDQIGAAFVKQSYSTIEECKAGAEEKVPQGKRQGLKQVKAVCIPMEVGSPDDRPAHLPPNEGPAVGENT